MYLKICSKSDPGCTVRKLESVVIQAFRRTLERSLMQM